MLLLIIMKINFLFSFLLFLFYTNQKKNMSIIAPQICFCVHKPPFQTIIPPVFSSPNVKKPNHNQSPPSFCSFYWQPPTTKIVSFNYRIILKIINLHLRPCWKNVEKIQFQNIHIKLCLFRLMNEHEMTTKQKHTLFHPTFFLPSS